MFEGLPREVTDVLHAAGADLPVAQVEADLLASMVAAVSSGAVIAPVAPRRTSMLGKVLTAKIAAVAGVLLLTGGVASAATGNLPDPAQDAASSAAGAVGLDIPKSDKAEKKDKAEKDNHGSEVSDTARDKANDGEGNHGSVVCEVASDGKCKPNADDTTDGDEPTTDTTAPGKSGEVRQDGENRKDPSTTTTTVDDDNADDSDDEPTTSTTAKVKPNQGKNENVEKPERAEGDNRKRG